MSGGRADAVQGEHGGGQRPRPHSRGLGVHAAAGEHPRLVLHEAVAHAREEDLGPAGQHARRGGGVLRVLVPDDAAVPRVEERDAVLVRPHEEPGGRLGHHVRQRVRRQLRAGGGLRGHAADVPELQGAVPVAAPQTPGSPPADVPRAAPVAVRALDPPRRGLLHGHAVARDPGDAEHVLRDRGQQLLPAAIPAGVTEDGPEAERVTAVRMQRTPGGWLGGLPGLHRAGVPERLLAQVPADQGVARAELVVLLRHPLLEVRLVAHGAALRRGVRGDGREEAVGGDGRHVAHEAVRRDLAHEPRRRLPPPRAAPGQLPAAHPRLHPAAGVEPPGALGGRAEAVEQHPGDTLGVPRPRAH
mmetsp:Transcript_32901/g.92398  ORF Transcript_32901/g.92398 Transcript_32901/m.92398 type:complete len:358 (+) Transcript_32901:282-1355(+)